MKAKGGLRVTMILDEFAALGKLEQVETLMGLGAGYKIRLWPILQDLNQLQRTYGDTWQTFVANCGVRQFFGIRDLNTGEFAAKAAGETTIIKASASIRELSAEEAMQGFSGISWSYAQEPRPFVMPQDILRLPPDQQVLYMDRVPYAINATRFPYWTVPLFRRLSLPDPWHDLPAALAVAEERRARGLLPPLAPPLSQNNSQAASFAQPVRARRRVGG